LLESKGVGSKFKGTDVSEIAEDILQGISGDNAVEAHVDTTPVGYPENVTRLTIKGKEEDAED
jgi:hypothetical protein